jgi:hypothetical protein
VSPGGLAIRNREVRFSEKRRVPCGTQLTSSHYNETSGISTGKTLKRRGPSILEDAWPRSKRSGNFPKGKVVNREIASRNIGDSVGKRFNTFRHSKPRIPIRSMTAVI